MIGLAGILASAVMIAAGVIIATLAGQLSDLPEIAQNLGLLLLLPVAFGIWWVAFNFFCNVLKVPR